MQRVLVLDKQRSPLMPCLPARARKLLSSGKAKVYRLVPFTIILTERLGGDIQKVQVKFDPGSRQSGIAVVADFKRGKTLIWAAELTHRGLAIIESLRSRASLRRTRRGRKTRYRPARFSNRMKPRGWLAPSLRSRVDNIVSWTDKLCRFLPVSSLGLEDVRFDTQLMQNPNIEGIAYQRGTLAGFELREYVLIRYQHICFYCLGESKDNILEIDHFIPRSRGGSDRVANLVLACHSCNQAKANTLPQEWKTQLSRSRSKLNTIRVKQLQRLISGFRPGFRDAAAVNSIRNAIKQALLSFNMPLETGSGGQTKFNRTNQSYPKRHFIDAACVGASGAAVLISPNMKVLSIRATGRGSRQMCLMDRFGFPRTSAKQVKRVEGFQSGDLVCLTQTSGKYKGVHTGKVSVRKNKMFDIQATFSGQKVSITAPSSRFQLLQKADGYTYSLA